MFCAVLAMLVAPSVQAADDVAAKKSDILRLFEVQPPRLVVDTAINNLANARYKANDPARDEFVSRLQLVVDYDAVERDATAVMLETFSAAELHTMAEYYTSDLGRAAEAKTASFRDKIVPKLQEMLDKAVLNVVTSPSPAESAVRK